MICQIYPVAARVGVYQWKWREADGTCKSTRAFDMFFDCVQDARSHGGAVDLGRMHRQVAVETLNLKIVAASEEATSKAAKHAV